MKNKPTYYLLLLPAVVVALSGCGSEAVWKSQKFAFSAPTEPPVAATSTNVVALGRISVSPLFESRSFTYRIAENTYEQDPYAEFIVAPERALAEVISTGLSEGGAFGRVVELGGGLVPSLIVEAHVSELDGDFRKPDQPVGVMSIHFMVYESNPDGSGRVLLDKICAGQTAMTRKTPAALMAAWDADLRKIMEELNTEYAKANLNDRR